MTALQIESVAKRFGGITAVDDLTMGVPMGKITGLIGPNGAGKTTVVNLITGVYALDQGSIRFGDLDLTEAPAHIVGQAGVARTFQSIRLLGETSVLDNIMIGFHRHERAPVLAQLLGLPIARRETAELRERAQALLSRFGMSRYTDYPAGGLSYGDQRRVEIMRALASEPEILLLDEPVAGMNDIEAERLGEVFLDLARDGMGVLLIEHNIRFIVRVCEYLHVLDGGCAIAQGTPDEIVADPAVIAAYLGG